MNILDIILLCIIAIFLIRGLLRGLVQEVLSLASTVLGIYLASQYSYLLAPHIRLYVENETTVGAMAYIIILFGTILVAWLLTKLIKTLLDVALLGWVDRSAGALFGGLEGALICLIILMFMQGFAPESTWLQESTIAPRTAPIVDYLGTLAPESMRDLFASPGTAFPSAHGAMEAVLDALGISPGQPQT